MASFPSPAGEGSGWGHAAHPCDGVWAGLKPAPWRGIRGRRPLAGRGNQACRLECKCAETGMTVSNCQTRFGGGHPLPRWSQVNPIELCAKAAIVVDNAQVCFVTGYE